MTLSSDTPAPPGEFNFIPDQLILYGVRLNGDWKGEAEHSGFINIDEGSPFLVGRGEQQGTLSLRLTLFRGENPLDNNHAVIAATYGYSFEGHCYRFDRPRVFLFERPTIGGRFVEDQDARGCGFESESDDGSDGYKMWMLRSTTPLLELNTGIGSVQQIVLDANLPGKRAPNTYDGHMRLAHRGRVMGGGSGP